MPALPNLSADQGKIVLWIREQQWQSVVDAALALPPNQDLYLLHIISSEPTEIAHESFLSLMGRDGHDPAEEIEAMATETAQELLGRVTRYIDQANRGHRVYPEIRTGYIEDEVVAFCSPFDLLVLARNKDRNDAGPASLDALTRHVADHATCAVLLVWP